MYQIIMVGYYYGVHIILYLIETHQYYYYFLKWWVSIRLYPLVI